MKTILSLPPEIIEIISTKLTKQDYYICLSVSKLWYDVFIHKLYKRLDIKTEQQLEQICNNLLKQSPRSLADSVRVIYLRIKHIKSVHLSQLSAWCINIEHFSLHWSIWNEDPKDIEINSSSSDNNNDNIKNDFSTSMASIIGPFRHLQRLQLDVSFGKNNSILPNFLPYLYHLTHLSLINSNHINLGYLEFIHQQFPLLKSLYLQGMNVERLDLFKNHSHHNQGDDNIITIHPATSLLSVELEFVNGGSEFYPYYLLYFSKKYPNLITFKMQQHSTFVSTEQISMFQRSHTQLCPYATTSLLKHCPQLSNIYIRDIYVHPDFFKRINHQLQHLSILYNFRILANANNNNININNNDHPQQEQQPVPLLSSLITGSSYISTIFSNPLLSQQLTSLDLIPFINDQINPITPDQFLSSISQLDQLKHLSFRWKMTPSHFFYLDTILQTFPNLITLDLSTMALAIKQQLDDDHLSSSSLKDYYLLSSLTLKGVSYHNNVFIWMNQHLTYLSHLKLTHSCRSHHLLLNEDDGDEGQIEQQPNNLINHHYIFLPDIKLQSLIINERGHQRRPIRLYMLHHVNEKRKNQLSSTTTMMDDYSPRFSHLQKQSHPTSSSSLMDKYKWYLLKELDHEIGFQCELLELNAKLNLEWEVPFHQIKLTSPWYAEFCDVVEEFYKNSKLVKDKVDSIQDIEYMNIVCPSINTLYINDQFLCF